MDLVRVAIKHKTLIVKSLVKRLDSLGDSGEDISGQKGYVRAKDKYAEHVK